MGKEVDEDLIEATIRRVSEARAASQAAGEGVASREAAAERAGGHDPKEDAIEATIRRVAEAKAAQTSAAPEDDEPAVAERPASVDEDAIEATIRRVAEAKAAQTSAAPDDDEPPVAERPTSVDESAIEATIRRVAEAKAAQTSAAPDDEKPGVAKHSMSVDESAIEATIRRVAEAKAAQASAPPLIDDAISAEHSTSADEDAIEATIRRVAEARAARDVVDDDQDVVDEAIAHAESALTPVTPEVELVTEIEPQHPVPLPDPAEIEDAPLTTYRRPRLVEAVPVASGSASAHDDVPDEAVARLEQGLHDTNRELQSLASRVDALMPMLERLASGQNAPAAREPAAMPQTRPTLVPNLPAAQDDDWDDTPAPSRIPVGLPPRPAILRDPSPMTATAAELVDDADEEPVVARASAPAAPAPVAAAAPEPRRGFDLLPKTYRITVEDKRRGVDLVPLHRALLAMDGVKDMSLLSYNNGVAIVAVETLGDIEPDVLSKSVSRAMAREVKVEVHNETTMVVKLAED